jgi:hypothetical protein
MNLDRVRERLSAAEVRTVFNHALVIYECPREAPPPEGDNLMVRQPGESDADVFKRHGIEIPKGVTPPVIRLRLS